jgi:fluoroquinolone transport system permease protein
MRQTLKVFSIGMHVVMRDAIMLFLIPAPLLVGITFHYLLPWLNQLLLERFGFSFEEWYPLADGLMIILTPTLLTMSSAFLLLEECDEGLGSYYQITPAKQFHYLMARIGLPALWGFLCAFSVIIACSFLAVLFGSSVAIMIVALASNRVEGLAISKLTGITMLGMFIAGFVSDSWRWLAGILPSFWLGELILEKALWFNLLLGTASSLIWIILFTRKFIKKIR